MFKRNNDDNEKKNKNEIDIMKHGWHSETTLRMSKTSNQNILDQGLLFFLVFLDVFLIVFHRVVRLTDTNNSKDCFERGIEYDFRI